jgi:hypothetical protein
MYTYSLKIKTRVALLKLNIIFLQEKHFLRASICEREKKKRIEKSLVTLSLISFRIRETDNTTHPVVPNPRCIDTLQIKGQNFC